MTRIGKIDHIGIAVRSVDSAIELYESIFGLKATGVEINAEFQVKICFIPIGEVLVEFLEPTEAGSPYDEFIKEKGEAIHHIAYSVDDIDSMLEEMGKKGIKLLNETSTYGGAGSKIAFIDPVSTNQILIELVERSKRPNSQE